MTGIPEMPEARNPLPTVSVVHPVTSHRRRSTGRVITWALFAVAAVHAFWYSLSQDFRRQPLVADQATFLYQALSIVHDRDLTFGATDALRWHTIGWTTNPAGLFFQLDHGRAVFAKPYGYSLYLAPFIGMFGPARGVAVANSVLLAIALVAVMALVHKRYSWTTSAAVAAALLLVTNAALYALPIGVEPFYLALTAVFFLAVWNGVGHRRWWGVVAVVLAAILLSEKQPMVLLVAPPVTYLLVKQTTVRARAVLVIIGLAVFTIAVFPYYHYSEGRSITPYGGVRYTSVLGDTWVGPGSDAIRSSAGQDGSLDNAGHKITKNPGLKFAAAAYFLFGQHTGLLVWTPIAVFVVILALLRWRRITLYGLVALGGMLAYVAFYVIVFPDNFYGGSQSLGNRYFVQIIPVVAAVAVGSEIRERRLHVAGFAAIVLTLGMVWPQVVSSPRDSLVHLERRSVLQRQLVWEGEETQGVQVFKGADIPRYQQPLSKLGLTPDDVPLPDVTHDTPG